jgi:hypothetical protein
MTLLTIAEGLAKNVGLRIPTVILTATEREWAEALHMANEAGEELARRVDWGVLTSSTTLTGDGTNLTFDLPADYARLTSGITIRSASGIVRPLTRAEWNGLTPAVGPPRYFLLEGDRVTLWPYLANLATVTVTYQSSEWASAGSSFMADTDTSLISEDVLLKCLIVRWRRQKGMPYADEEAEYEAALADAARFDDRGRL